MSPGSTALAAEFSKVLFYVDADEEHVFRWSDQRLVAENDPLLCWLPERMAEVADRAAAGPVLDAARALVGITDDPNVCSSGPRYTEAIDELRKALAVLDRETGGES